MYTEIKCCRICKNENLVDILDLGNQALTGVFPKPDECVEQGPLQLVKCIGGGQACGLVQLKHSFESEKMYGDNYGYRSGLNASMVMHLTEIVSKIENFVHLKDEDLIIDIGSNDGTLLSKYTNRTLDFLGMDPTGRKFIKYYPEDVELYSDFFSANNVRSVRKNKKAKVITSIAMFYDLENPIQFAKEIESILEAEGIWVFEQSYLPLMLKTVSYDTVCHEHLEFYCLKQIEYILGAANLRIVDVITNDINGGSFQIMAAKENACYETSVNVEKMRGWEENNGFAQLEIYKEFKKKVEINKKKVMSFLQKAKKEGKTVLGYGASTKGNVMLQYCGITNKDILAIADVNEDKFGHVTPGTCIPIISEEDAKKMNPDYFLVLPWHFKDNILDREKNYIAESGCKFCFAFSEFTIVE